MVRKLGANLPLHPSQKGKSPVSSAVVESDWASGRGGSGRSADCCCTSDQHGAQKYLPLESLVRFCLETSIPQLAHTFTTSLCAETSLDIAVPPQCTGR